jgi:hypothetical protein
MNTSMLVSMGRAGDNREPIVFHPIQLAKQNVDGVLWDFITDALGAIQVARNQLHIALHISLS